MQLRDVERAPITDAAGLERLVRLPPQRPVQAAHDKLLERRMVERPLVVAQRKIEHAPVPVRLRVHHRVRSALPVRRGQHVRVLGVELVQDVELVRDAEVRNAIRDPGRAVVHRDGELRHLAVRLEHAPDHVDVGRVLLPRRRCSVQPDERAAALHEPQQAGLLIPGQLAALRVDHHGVEPLEGIPLQRISVRSHRYRIPARRLDKRFQQPAAPLERMPLPAHQNQRFLLDHLTSSRGILAGHPAFRLAGPSRLMRPRS